MPLWQQYVRPASLAEALQALGSAPGPVCPIAGGTDLILDLHQGRRPPVHTLVDVTCIAELTVLEGRGSELYIGAAVPHSQIVASPLVRQQAQALAEACSLIGGPQVRNVATLGGNVAHALPAADGAIALLALDAEVEVADAQPKKNSDVRMTRVPLLDLYLGPGKTALKPGQLLTGFYLPLVGHGHGSAFTRVMRDQGVALPILNMAVGMVRKEEIVADLRIAIGPAGLIPRRAGAAESTLRGKPLTPEYLQLVENAMLAEVLFRTSPLRATARYRQHLAGTLLADGVRKAWERTR